MSQAVRKNKKKREANKKGDARKDAPTNVVVTKQLADNTYTGIIKAGQLGSQFLDCSSASYQWAKGAKYEGPFVQSQINGKGKFLWPDGSTYEGELFEGKRHGHGLYLAADGETCYEGQWQAGKRHGIGKLTYKAASASFYDGGWAEGSKNGFGTQVWPSGNCYQGQWVNGKMRGQGTMTWKMAQGASEVYSGHWEDNHPHGEGTHTWHACEPITDEKANTTDGIPRPLPTTQQSQYQQQLNNCYKGQWNRGSREGVGTFYYANGAYYHGEWKDHVKNGHGRHTFEDGRVYDGEFVDDHMKGDENGDASPGQASGGASDKLSAGAGGELAISQRIDIEDLTKLAVPRDQRGFELSAGTGYRDPDKVLREVYNMLLRHLGELRDFYKRYRMLLPMPGQDPFVLRLYQFWMLAWDMGLITESCSIARFDRAVFSGGRVHGEVAPGDIDDNRPLTPRDERERRNSLGSKEGHHSHHARLAEPAGSQDSQGGSEDASEDGGDAGKDSPAGSNYSASSPTHVQFLESIVEADTPPPEEAKENVPPEEKDAEDAGEGHGKGELGGKFKRIIGDSDLASSHDPMRPLLFRQFMESLVRLSLARFPHEQGLEAQIHRLFKERLLPRSSEMPASEHLFEFLVEKDSRQVMEAHESLLWPIFQGLASRTGAPQIVAAMATAGSAAGSSSEAFQEQEYPYCAGPLGRSRRRMHVGARLDVTLRVKDMLKLLEAAGLLRPFPRSERPTDNSTAEIFPDLDEYAATDAGMDDGKGSEDEHGESADQEEDDDAGRGAMKGLGFGDKTAAVFAGIKDNYGANTINSSALGFMKGSILNMGDGGWGSDFILGDVPEARDPDAREEKKTNKRKDKQQEVEPELDADGVPIPRVVDFANCDHTVSPLLTLGVLGETMPGAHLPRVRWQLDPTVPGTTGREAWVSLLDYAESEIVFSEFQRCLVRIAELTTRRDGSLCAKFPPAKRLEGFLRHVFLPAMRTPYSPPGDRDSGKGGPAGKPRQTRKQSRGDTSTGDADEKAGDDDEAVDSSRNTNPDEPLSWWHGFDVADVSSVGKAPRCWPKDYDQEVKDY